MSPRIRTVFSSLFAILLCAVSAASVNAAPSVVTTLAATTNCQVQLQWNAPDNGAGAPCGSYLVKYSTIAAIIDEAAFDNSTTYYQSWIPLSPGATETKILTGLPPRITYWFSIKSSSDALWSALSSTSTSLSVTGSFIDSYAGLPGVRNSALTWGDYDNDGDLDLALSGYTGSENVTGIFRNNTGSFINADAGLFPVYWGSLSWGDYDNDGDLDLALSGTQYSAWGRTRVYRNDAGRFVNASRNTIAASYESTLSWGDYDNDGDLDLALAGNGVTRLSRIYRNDARSFVDTGAGLTGLSVSSLSWGDYDNDGDLDLALAGYTGSVRLAYVYRNDTGLFANTSAALTGSADCSVSWGDYDNDGDLDLALAGNAAAFFTRVYRNDALSFVVGASVTGVRDSSVSWGDYDNDGDLDLAVAGLSAAASYLSRVYRNDMGSFADTVAGLPGTGGYCALSWGDYDNDGDLDLSLSGTNGSAAISRIYTSLEAQYGNGNGGSRAPGAPSMGLSIAYSTATFKLLLRWDKAADNGTGATAENGLYYEIRMATEPISDNLRTWIISPSTGAGVGSGASQLLGSYPHGYHIASSTQTGIDIVPPVAGATYYWQVRSLDAGLRKSAWSVEQSTYVPVDTWGPGQVLGFSAAGGSQVQLNWTAPGDDGYVGNVSSGMWRIDYSSVTETPGETGGGTVVSLYYPATWTQGTQVARMLTGLLPHVTYYLQIKACDYGGNWGSVWSSSVSAVAGSCIDACVNIQAGYGGYPSWGDYDNDGDLDFVSGGDTGSRIYRNDSSQFVNTIYRYAYSNFGTYTSWGDYDNDGDLDLAVGIGYSEIGSRIVRNDGGSTFVEMNAGVPGLGFIAWGDYDNDGDLDLAASESNTGPFRIFANSAGQLTYVNTGMTGAGYGQVSWGDYDNDGDLDIGLNGMYGSYQYLTRIYRNDGGSFIDSGAALTGAYYSALAWGDYDSDGDLDLACAGIFSWPDGRYSRVYRNTAGSFVDAGAGMTGAGMSSVCWGDYDNDGDLDLALAGAIDATNSCFSRVYLNDADSFVDGYAGLPGTYYASLVWGDYDNDGDLDLALSGSAVAGASIARMFKSLEAEYDNANSGARAPSPPAPGFSSEFSTSAYKLSLRWGMASDNGAGSTPQQGLSYELRMATEPINEGITKWIIAPTKGSGVGAGPNQRVGSYPHGYCIAASTQPGIDMMPPLLDATYYWQVRTVDAGLRASDWSVEQSTYVPPDTWSPGKVLGVTAVTGLQVILTWTAPGDNEYTGNVTGGMWRIDYSSCTETPGDTGGSSVYSLYSAADFSQAAQYTRVMTGLAANVTYYFQLKARDGTGHWSLSWSSSASCIAGTFINSAAGFPGLTESTLGWGDYDNDGDLDLLLSGKFVSVNIGRMYRNDAGSFVDINAGLPAVFRSAASWGDYDNDGDLDLVYAGQGVGVLSRVYRNDAGSFVDINAGLQGSYRGVLSWGDYDNDGDLDLAVLSGYSGFTRVYRNDAGILVDSDAGIPAFDLGSLSWGDYDNDGDLDLAIAGTYSRYARIYRNDASKFIGFNPGLTGVQQSSLAWGDYDNDGDLDLSLSGYADTRIARVYRNNAGNFSVHADMTGVMDGSGSWGDYDNDGDLDLALAGAASAAVSRVYRNDAGVFVSPFNGVAGVTAGFVSFGDYDDDGDLDLALTGNSVSVIYTSFESESGNSNKDARAPSAPSTGFGASYNDTTSVVALQWDPAADNGAGATPAAGLYYEVRVATQPINEGLNTWVVSPSKGAGTGSCSTQRLGSYPHGYCVASSTHPGFNLSSPVSGATYFWQVRTMDAGLRKSPWSLEQSTYVPADIWPPGQVSGVAARPGTQVLLTWIAPGDNGMGGDVTNGLWRIDCSSAVETPGETGGSAVWTIYREDALYTAGSQNALLITGLMPQVTYYFQMKARDEWGNWSAAWSNAAAAMAGSMMDSGIALIGLGSSAQSWGDYDNDGDLDLAMCGDGAQYTSIIYRNDGNSFVDSNAGLQGVYEGGVSWGDYDNDGDLDLALSGEGTLVYRNDGGSFVDGNAGLPMTYEGDLAWGDYDNDGDLDLALCGYDSNWLSMSCIYRNDADCFVIPVIGTPGASEGSLSWGDYDNDGDLDLALAGYDGESFSSRIYRNDAGRFGAFSAGLTGVYYCALGWGDYDNDGDLDLALSGSDNSYVARTRIYRNNAGSMDDTTAGVLGVEGSALSWGDYDNDGDLDLAVSGDDDSYANRTRIYRNDGSSFVDSRAGLTDTAYGAMCWGDYDADGDLDLALSGDGGQINISRIYQSLEAEYGNSNSGSRAPSAPVSGFGTAYSTTACTLSLLWDKALDNGAGATPSDGLYYDVRMATEPVSDIVRQWVISPSVGRGVGSGPTQRLGSYPHGYCAAGVIQPGLTITNPPNGATYYWQVRAMDAGLATSAWSVEQSTYVPPESIPPGQVTGLTAVSGLQVLLSWVAPGDNAYAQNVVNGMWRVDYSSATETPGIAGGNTVFRAADYVPGMRYSLTITGLVPRATYYFQVIGRDESGNWGPVWSSSASAVAGSFYELNAALPSVSECALAWGDFDNDGDLDLALSGDNGSALLCRLYRNDAGCFVDSLAGLGGASVGSLSWADADNDGDLDLASTGSGTDIYRNDAGMFVNSNAGMPGVSYSSLRWGDYDNDGDLDIALSGNGSGYLCRVYRNEAACFIDSGAALPGHAYSAVGWGDCDNDGDLDLALAGYTGSENLSRIYLNDAGSFIDSGAALIAVRRAALVWGDFDNDGDLDLALAGHAGAEGLSLIYTNDAGNFGDSNAGLSGVYYSSLSCGDYDDDGDLDLVLAGQADAASYLTSIYRNDAGSFADSCIGLPGIYWGGSLWGDHDNDGDLDLVLLGSAGSTYVSKIYNSLDAQHGHVNDAPSAPSGMAAMYHYAAGRSTITFSWEPGQYDAGRSQHALYYQVAAATNPMVWDGAQLTGPAHFIMPWQAGSSLLGNYVRPVARVWPGDAGARHALFLTTDNIALQPGTTYYWRVQTIDAGLRRSAWSPEYSICASSGDAAPPAGISNLSALAVGVNAVRLSWTSPGDDDTGGDLVNALFRIKYSSVGVITAGNFDAPPLALCANTVDIATTTAASSYQTMTLATLTDDGTYWFAVKTMDNAGNWSVWRSSADVPVVNTLAWSYVSATSPGQITGLAASPGAQVSLTWTAPGNNWYTGNVTGGTWRIDYSSITTIPGGASGVYSLYVSTDFTQGEVYNLTVTGLQPQALYYFQMLARDAAGNWGNAWSDPAGAVAATFGDSGAGLMGVSFSALTWGDYDNDGDLDLALAGSSISRVYRNDAGSFVNATGASLVGVISGALTWGDYDNDGDLDLALAGWGTGNIFRLYRNNANSFVDAPVAGIPGVQYCSLSWGDYDNDGDLDLALAGYPYVSCVYRNDAGSFTGTSGASIAAVANCSLSWGDYDNDGDLDLALAGTVDESVHLSRVYRNDAGSFANATGGSIPGAQLCALSWGDYDNDGDLDLALAGDGGSYMSRIYRNDAGSFANVAAVSMAGVSYCSLSWGDYDNDGDLDLALAGDYAAYDPFSRVYRNDDGSFINAAGGGLTGVRDCSLSWGDYDNDGDLDLALSGLSVSGGISTIYQSLEADYGNGNTGSRLPSAPSSGLGAAFNSLNRHISLRWNQANDNGPGATPQNGLSYEIRVSTQAWTTTPDGVTKWCVSPSTGLGAGSAASQNQGNYPHGYCDAATLQPGVNLTMLVYDATYYWQVRTIDAGLGRSPWSAVQSRYVSAVDAVAPAGISDVTVLFGGSCALTLTWTAPGTDGISGDLVAGSQFRIKYSTVGILTAGNFDAPPAYYAARTVDISTTAAALSAQTLTLTGLTPAPTCWFAIKAMDAWGNWSVWHSSADVAFVNTLAWRAVISLPPAPVTDLTAAAGAAEGAVALTWTSPHENDDNTGGSISRYIVRHATFGASSLSGGPTAWWAHTGLTTGLVISSASVHVPGVTETGMVTGLAPGVTYYFGIVSEDGFAGVSDMDARAYVAQAMAPARDLPPDPPTGLTAVSVSTYSVSLAWNVMSACTGYMDFSYYALYRSTAGAVMALVSTTTLNVYVDTAVIAATTYFYQLNAVDGEPSPLSGGMCPAFAVCLPEAPFLNTAIPRAPAGIKLESTRSARTIRWSPVRYNVDGTPSTNLGWYAVYRSNNPRDGWTLAGTADTCAWNDTASFTGTWYYKVRAITTDNVESAASMLCDTAFNILAVSDDRRALLTIPHTIAAPLYQGQVCDEDVTIVCAPLGAQSSLATVDVYELSALDSQTDEKIRSFQFPQTRAKLTYFCPDMGAPADTLSFAWFNGVEWIRVGTETEGDSIVTLTSRLGKYAVRETIKATTFTLYSVYPKTFSPNGDSRNDHVEFQYENPRDASVVGKIYDKAGALVTELREGIQMDSLLWDGTTSKGTRARPGAYVYQIEVTGSESKVINGIVVVAR